jgi:hypothetical protein
VKKRTLLIVAMFAFSMSVKAEELPETKEFMNIFMTCGMGSNIELEGNLRGSIEDVYQKGRMEGKASQKIMTDIIRLIPENQRVAVYEKYLSCVDKQLSSLSGRFNKKKYQFNLTGQMALERIYRQVAFGLRRFQDPNGSDVSYYRYVEFGVINVVFQQATTSSEIKIWAKNSLGEWDIIFSKSYKRPDRSLFLQISERNKVPSKEILSCITGKIESSYFQIYDLWDISIAVSSGGFSNDQVDHFEEPLVRVHSYELKCDFPTAYLESVR